MCKPINVSAADNCAELLFGHADMREETPTQKATKTTDSKKVSKKNTKAKVQVEGDKVIAERFRTKQCKSFIETGCCPYESRCMFAHGDHELRTAKQNLQDGLVSEEAIRQFKKMMNLKLRARQAEMRHQTTRVECSPVSSPSHASASDSDGPSETSSSCDELEHPSRTFVGNSYYYNPYGWQALKSPIESTVDAYPAAY